MFTVIVPTHNRPLLLQRTLDSLIAQTYTDFQVIVVDDAATYLPPYEKLLALQNRYTYVIRSGAKGPAVSRDMGLQLARSRYVLFLDDDDTLEPTHLQALADAIGDRSPELLFCDFKVCNEDRTVQPPRWISTAPVSIADATQDSIYVRNRIPNSCLTYRRDLLDGVCNDGTLIIYEDWDFLLQAVAGRTLEYLPINSVTIHKSQADAADNMRRGNTHDEKIVEVMLYLYRKYPAPNLQTRLARQSLMASVGVALDLDAC